MRDNNVVPFESFRRILIDFVAQTVQACVNRHRGGRNWVCTGRAANVHCRKQYRLSFGQAFCVEENKCLAKGVIYRYFYAGKDDRVLP